MTSPSFSITANIEPKRLEGTWSLECLVELLYRYHPSDVKLMAFLEAYCDESGTHGADHLVVGGFLGHAQDWLRFCEPWSNALRDQGVPFFKAQWFAKRKAFFRGWGNDERRRMGFMTRLLEIIRSANVVPICTTIPLAEYNRLVPPGRIRNRLGSAYTLCAAQNILMCAHWARENEISEPIRYVFDAGHTNRGEFDAAHRAASQDPKERDAYLVGSLTFDDEQKVLPLQAADLLAYECAQHLQGKLGRYPLQFLSNLGAINEPIAWMFSADQLSEMVTNLASDRQDRLGHPR